MTTTRKPSPGYGTGDPMAGAYPVPKSFAKTRVRCTPCGREFIEYKESADNGTGDCPYCRDFVTVEVVNG